VGGGGGRGWGFGWRGMMVGGDGGGCLAKLALKTARDSKLVIRLPYFSRKLARIVEKKVG
jgi:hypothetical protein